MRASLTILVLDISANSVSSVSTWPVTHKGSSSKTASGFLSSTHHRGNCTSVNTLSFAYKHPFFHHTKEITFLKAFYCPLLKKIFLRTNIQLSLGEKKKASAKTLNCPATQRNSHICKNNCLALQRKSYFRKFLHTLKNCLSPQAKDTSTNTKLCTNIQLSLGKKKKHLPKHSTVQQHKGIYIPVKTTVYHHKRNHTSTNFYTL